MVTESSHLDADLRGLDATRHPPDRSRKSSPACLVGDMAKKAARDRRSYLARMASRGLVRTSTVRDQAAGDGTQELGSMYDRPVL